MGNGLFANIGHQWLSLRFLIQPLFISFILKPGVRKARGCFPLERKTHSSALFQLKTALEEHYLNLTRNAARDDRLDLFAECDDEVSVFILPTDPKQGSHFIANNFLHYVKMRVRRITVTVFGVGWESASTVGNWRASRCCGFPVNVLGRGTPSIRPRSKTSDLRAVWKHLPFTFFIQFSSLKERNWLFFPKAAKTNLQRTRQVS